jgi:hypothetical protein
LAAGNRNALPGGQGVSHCRTFAALFGFGQAAEKLIGAAISIAL